MNERAARGRVPLRIRVRFEPGRASRDVMARGYEQAVPIVRAVVAADDVARDQVVAEARHRPSRKQEGGAA